MKTKKAKPFQELQLGHVKAAIWKNQIRGAVHYRITFGRLDKNGGRWKPGTAFGPADLLLLAKLADHAHAWITGFTQTGSRNVLVPGPPCPGSANPFNA